MSDYRATNNNALVQVPQAEVDMTTAGGILIPGEYKPLPTQGIVISVGSLKTPKGVSVEPEVKVGDMVLFPERAVTEIDADAGIYSLRQWSILAILPPAVQCNIGGPTGRTPSF